MQQDSAYVSSEEAAKYFGVQSETIRRLCRDGKIPGARRIGGQWRIPRAFLTDDVDTVQKMTEENNK